MIEPVLCYISEDWEAWFTTQALEDQWGDDWNDAPYECNAGLPYAWRDGDTEPEWKLTRIRVEPAEYMRIPVGMCNGEYHTVEDMNKKLFPWVNGRGFVIWAGTQLSEFKRIIKENGGTIFIEEVDNDATSIS
jgi:hypothetical protein